MGGKALLLLKSDQLLEKMKKDKPKIDDVYLIQIQCGSVVSGGPQYICPKHGDIAAPMVIIDSQGHKRLFCLECISDFFNEHLGQVCRWEDELTKHDFEEKE